MDSAVAPALGEDLNTFIQDLTGDGWQVIQREVSRSSSVSAVREVIRSEYYADPAQVRAVILLGHIPVPYSGAISPDLHPTHFGAWPADVYYADVDGIWTDHSVDVTSAGNDRNHNVPGDGKFDQSTPPSEVELEIGRIDFHDLPSFQPRDEVDLLRAYLRKNHRFRHRQFTLPRRGLVRDNFGDIAGDAPAVDAWRYFPAFFGPDRIVEAGQNAFFSTLSSEAFLWSYACGGGDYKSLDAVGSSGDFAAQNPRTSFLILHGSYFGDWDNTDNLLRAAAASGDYALASIWSGLPHWFMHPMALGETIGYTTRLAQNNRTTYQSNRNFSAAEVHISLIGDPTLRMFPVIPPANLTASVGSQVNLAWQASSDNSISGYHVYHGSDILGPYQRLTASPVVGTSYSHNIGSGIHFYMVRAIKLETTGSGTFYNPSQGIFLQVNKDSGGETPVVTITLEDEQAGEFGPDSGSFRISRTPVSSGSLQVQLSIGGTAGNGTDYESIPPYVTIPGGSASALMQIHPRADALDESTETVSLAIVPGSNYTVGSPAAASLEIADYQPNSRPTISEISDTATGKNLPTSEILFTIGDAQTAPGNLSVRATSANQILFPDDNLHLGGSGPDRTLVATPAEDELGIGKITLIVSDGMLEATRVFNIAVTNFNSPPIIEELELDLEEDTVLPITLAATDPEGATLTFTVATPPEFGRLDGSAPSLTYTPDTNYAGPDSFTVEVSDGEKAASAKMTLHVLPRNDPPYALPQSIILQENTPQLIQLTAQDPDSKNLVFSVTTGPSHGVLVGTPPEITYEPDSHYHGEDVFTFSVSDGESTSQAETISLTIAAIDDPPGILAPPDILIRKNSSTALLPIVLSDSDTPADNLVLTAASLSPGILPNTNLVLSGSGEDRFVSATPTADRTGIALVELRASDGTSTATAEFRIVVTNTPPSALDDELQIPPGVVRVSPETLLQNDQDPDGDELTIVRVESATQEGGLVSLAMGSIYYTPPAGGPVPDQFAYTIEDSSGAQASGFVALLPLEKPVFTQILKVPTGILLRFAGPPDQPVRIEATSNTTAWDSLAELTTDENGMGDYLDASPASIIRIYRIEQP